MVKTENVFFQFDDKIIKVNMFYSVFCPFRSFNVFAYVFYFDKII